MGQSNVTVSAFGGTSFSGTAPHTIKVSASTNIVSASYSWYWDTDGTNGVESWSSATSGFSATNTYTSAGYYKVKCLVKPDWVYMDTFIEENFTNSAFNDWWDDDYKSHAYISAYPPPDGKYVSLDRSSGLETLRLSPSGICISGDFDLRMKVIWRSTCVEGENESEHLIVYPCNNTTFPNGSICEVVGNAITTSTYNIAWFAPTYKQGLSSPKPSFSAWDYYWMGIERKDDSISGKYDLGDGNGWKYFEYPVTCASPIFIGLNQATNPGIAHFWFQADGGFLEYKDISTYNLEITDSVMVNFIRNTSADFSACNAIINNSTFNNTSAAISGNFI